MGILPMAAGLRWDQGEVVEVRGGPCAGGVFRDSLHHSPGHGLEAHATALLREISVFED